MSISQCHLPWAFFPKGQGLFSAFIRDDVLTIPRKLLHFGHFFFSDYSIFIPMFQV
jgi:hypothetical protein